jgi:hypothetical protein
MSAFLWSHRRCWHILVSLCIWELWPWMVHVSLWIVFFIESKCGFSCLPPRMDRLPIHSASLPP